MKKQIIILAAATMPLAFFSCSKGSIEPQQANNSMTTDEVISSPKPGAKPINLKAALAGMFEFDGNLKDKTGQLPDAVPNVPGATMYTTDRRGVVNNAIQFTGRYGVDILNVPTQPNTSVAAWVKYGSVLPSPVTVPFVSSGNGPNFDQELDQYIGVIITPNTTGVFQILWIITGII